MGEVDVGVAVDPPLLADVLVRLLWRPEWRVHHHDGPATHTCDIAVITAGHQHDVNAPTVIRLPGADDRSESGSVVSPRKTRVVSIRSLEEVVALLEGCLADDPGGRPR